MVAPYTGQCSQPREINIHCQGGEVSKEKGGIGERGTRSGQDTEWTLGLGP